MAKHSGGDGETMKSGGNWKGTKGQKEETKPFEKPKPKEKGPEHKDILKPGE